MGKKRTNADISVDLSGYTMEDSNQLLVNERLREAGFKNVPKSTIQDIVRKGGISTTNRKTGEREVVPIASLPSQKQVSFIEKDMESASELFFQGLTDIPVSVSAGIQQMLAGTDKQKLDAIRKWQDDNTNQISFAAKRMLENEEMSIEKFMFTAGNTVGQIAGSMATAAAGAVVGTAIAPGAGTVGGFLGGMAVNMPFMYNAVLNSALDSGMNVSDAIPYSYGTSVALASLETSVLGKIASWASKPIVPSLTKGVIGRVLSKYEAKTTNELIERIGSNAFNKEVAVGMYKAAKNNLSDRVIGRVGVIGASMGVESAQEVTQFYMEKLAQATYDSTRGKGKQAGKGAFGVEFTQEDFFGKKARNEAFWNGVFGAVGGGFAGTVGAVSSPLYKTGVYDTIDTFVKRGKTVDEAVAALNGIIDRRIGEGELAQDIADTAKSAIQNVAQSYNKIGGKFQEPEFRYVVYERVSKKDDLVKELSALESKKAEIQGIIAQNQGDADIYTVDMMEIDKLIDQKQRQLDFTSTWLKDYTQKYYDNKKAKNNTQGQFIDDSINDFIVRTDSFDKKKQTPYEFAKEANDAYNAGMKDIDLQYDSQVKSMEITSLNENVNQDFDEIDTIKTKVRTNPSSSENPEFADVVLATDEDGNIAVRRESVIDGQAKVDYIPIANTPQYEPVVARAKSYFENRDSFEGIASKLVLGQELTADEADLYEDFADNIDGYKEEMERTANFNANLALTKMFAKPIKEALQGMASTIQRYQERVAEIDETLARDENIPASNQDLNSTKINEKLSANEIAKLNQNKQALLAEIEKYNQELQRITEMNPDDSPLEELNSKELALYQTRMAEVDILFNEMVEKFLTNKASNLDDFYGTYGQYGFLRNMEEYAKSIAAQKRLFRDSYNPEIANTISKTIEKAKILEAKMQENRAGIEAAKQKQEKAKAAAEQIKIEKKKADEAKKILKEANAKLEQEKKKGVPKTKKGEPKKEEVPQEQDSSLEAKKAEINKIREGLDTSTSAGYSVIASDYLFTGGKGSMLSTDYLLQALIGSFPFSGKKIDEIRNRYASVLGTILDDIETDSYNNAIKEVRDVIDKTYNNSEVILLFDEIINNSTGFSSRDGSRVRLRLESLNDEYESDINKKLSELESSIQEQEVQEETTETVAELEQVIKEAGDIIIEAANNIEQIRGGLTNEQQLPTDSTENEGGVQSVQTSTAPVSGTSETTLQENVTQGESTPEGESTATMATDATESVVPSGSDDTANTQGGGTQTQLPNVSGDVKAEAERLRNSIKGQFKILSDNNKTGENGPDYIDPVSTKLGIASKGEIEVAKEGLNGFFYTKLTSGIFGFVHQDTGVILETNKSIVGLKKSIKEKQGKTDASIIPFRADLIAKANKALENYIKERDSARAQKQQEETQAQPEQQVKPAEKTQEEKVDDALGKLNDKKFDELPEGENNLPSFDDIAVDDVEGLISQKQELLKKNLSPEDRELIDGQISQLYTELDKLNTQNDEIVTDTKPSPSPLKAYNKGIDNPGVPISLKLDQAANVDTLKKLLGKDADKYFNEKTANVVISDLKSSTGGNVSFVFYGDLKDVTTSTGANKKLFASRKDQLEPKKISMSADEFASTLKANDSALENLSNLKKLGIYKEGPVDAGVKESPVENTRANAVTIKADTTINILYEEDGVPLSKRLNAGNKDFDMWDDRDDSIVVSSRKFKAKSITAITNATGKVLYQRGATTQTQEQTTPTQQQAQPVQQATQVPAQSVQQEAQPAARVSRMSMSEIEKVDDSIVKEIARINGIIEKSDFDTKTRDSSGVKIKLDKNGNAIGYYEKQRDWSYKYIEEIPSFFKKDVEIAKKKRQELIDSLSSLNSPLVKKLNAIKNMIGADKLIEFLNDFPFDKRGPAYLMDTNFMSYITYTVAGESTLDKLSSIEPEIDAKYNEELNKATGKVSGPDIQNQLLEIKRSGSMTFDSGSQKFFNRFAAGIERIFPGVSIGVLSEQDWIDSGLSPSSRGAFNRKTGQVMLREFMYDGSTFVHEVGHAIMKIIGDVDTNLYNSMLDAIEGTKYEAYVRDNYPNLTTREEVLSEAMGYAIQDKGVKMQSRPMAAFRDMMTKAFNAIKKFMGYRTNKDIGDMTLDEFTSEVAGVMFGIKDADMFLDEFDLTQNSDMNNMFETSGDTDNSSIQYQYFKFQANQQQVAKGVMRGSEYATFAERVSSDQATMQETIDTLKSIVDSPILESQMASALTTGSGKDKFDGYSFIKANLNDFATDYYNIVTNTDAKNLTPLQNSDIVELGNTMLETYADQHRRSHIEVVQDGKQVQAFVDPAKEASNVNKNVRSFFDAARAKGIMAKYTAKFLTGSMFSNLSNMDTVAQMLSGDNGIMKGIQDLRVQRNKDSARVYNGMRKAIYSTTEKLTQLAVGRGKASKKITGKLTEGSLTPLDEKVNISFHNNFTGEATLENADFTLKDLVSIYLTRQTQVDRIFENKNAKLFNELAKLRKEIIKAKKVGNSTRVAKLQKEEQDIQLTLSQLKKNMDDSDVIYDPTVKDGAHLSKTVISGSGRTSVNRGIVFTLDNKQKVNVLLTRDQMKVIDDMFEKGGKYEEDMKVMREFWGSQEVKNVFRESNEVSYRITGKRTAEIQGLYFPIKKAMSDTLRETEIDPNIKNLRFVLETTGLAGNVEGLDIFSIMNEYMEQSTEYIANAEYRDSLRTYRNALTADAKAKNALLGSNDVEVEEEFDEDGNPIPTPTTSNGYDMEVIDSINTALKGIDDMVKSLDSGLKSRRDANRELDKAGIPHRIYNLILSNFSKAVFSFNLGNLFKQSAGYLAGIGQGIVESEYIYREMGYIGKIIPASMKTYITNDGKLFGKDIGGFFKVKAIEREMEYLEKHEYHFADILRRIQDESAYTGNIDLDSLDFILKKKGKLGDVYRAANKTIFKGLSAMRMNDAAVIIAFVRAARAEVTDLVRNGKLLDTENNPITDVESPKALRLIAEKASELVYRTNNMYMENDKTPLQRSNNILHKSIGLFSSQPQKISNLFAQRFMSAAQDGFKNEYKNKVMQSTMVWAMLAGAALQSSITIMYGILRNGYDEEREYELDFFYEFIRNFTGMFPSLPVEVLNGLLSALDNAPWTGDIASNPVFSLLENAIKATAALKESMDEDKPEFIRDRKYQEGVRQGADALAKIFGAPTVAVNFIVKQALLEDKK